MADSGAAALEEEGLGSSPVAEDENDKSSRDSRPHLPPPLTWNPSCAAQHETGEGHSLIDNSDSIGDGRHGNSNRIDGNATVGVGKAEAGQDLDHDHEGVETLSIHPGSVEYETCGAAVASVAPAGGPLHDEPISSTSSASVAVLTCAIPGTSHSSGCGSGKGKAAAGTETSTPPPDVVVPVGEQTQDMTTSAVDPEPAKVSVISDDSSNSSIGSSSIYADSIVQQDKGKGRDIGLDCDPPSSSYPKPSNPHHSPTVSQLPLPPTQSASYQPPQAGDPGWETSADRPPKKLPIRFRDAVGRNFLFPWDKAKTWDGMKSLIDSAFLYDVLAHHVHAGHFDLVSSSFSTPGIARNMPSTTFLGIPSPTVGSPAAHTTSSVAGAESPSSSPSSSTIPSPGTLGAEAPAASGPATGGNTSQSTQFIILPDVWEDMVEPGMFVTQHMWPMTPQNPPPQQQPPPPPPQPPLMPQPQHLPLTGHGPGPGPVPGRGRGRGTGVVVPMGGRGTFLGRGVNHPGGGVATAPPFPPPPPPFFPAHHRDVRFVSRTRVKSRKRPEMP